MTNGETPMTGTTWAMILAGGEGSRLRSFTRLIAGDERPKQFCAVLGDRPLLETTRRRAALLAPADRTVIVLTRGHERFYSPLVTDVPSAGLVVQPQNRGTAPAILYSLLRISASAPMATVVVLPSDHHVSNELAFARHVEHACAAVAARPELVVLLGASASSAETEYGWIEPGEPLPGGTVRRVGRFWEKPTAALAEILLKRGCLWNTFVMVAGVPALLATLRGVAGALYRAFEPVIASLETLAERAAAELVYRSLPAVGFSETVLAARPPNLVVRALTGLDWSDLGSPDRVTATRARLEHRPASVTA
jgi:mannose-1-phosphate guanylyltransferase